MKRGGVAAALLLAAGAWASTAGANTTEDLLGLGGRSNAMGGAGTALATDSTAAWYGPANLAFCGGNQAGVHLQHTRYGLDVAGAAGQPEARELRDQTRLTIGTCSQLPYALSMGLMFGLNLQNPMTLETGTLTDKPQFALYGDPLEQLTIVVGGAWRPWRRLSVGVGVAILVNSVLALDTAFPVAEGVEGGEVSTDLRWDLGPTGALYLGLHAEPVDGLHLAMTWRGALFHDLEAPASVDVSIAGIFLEVDLLLEAASWYSPQQLALGAAWDPVEALTVAFDLTWYGWSSYPGPFLIATPAGGPDSVASTLVFPPREDFGFVDVIQPRLGVEWRLMSGLLALRAGYSLRPTPAPIPSQRSNLLDGDVHAFSLGAGLRLDDDPEVPGGQPGGSLSFDLFARSSHMARRQVDRPADPDADAAPSRFDFGGSIMEAGLSFTLGWQ